MPSSNGLFFLCTLIWGSTWFVIRFQLGTVAPEVSVVYRFTLAATLLLGFSALSRARMRFSLREHLLMAAQGAFMFGGNYVLTYHSERFLASGLVAVVFSLIVFFNIVGMRVFFSQPIALEMLFGAICGVSGLALLFWPEFGRLGADTPKGLVIATVATLIAAVGNLIAAYNQQQGIPIQSSTGFAMLYGAMLVAMWVLGMGIPWSFLATPAYLGSLAYLAVFGSIVAFLSYLTLAHKIGVDRAGYVGVTTPVVALGLSTLLEGYRWTAPAVAGAVLAMGGNVLILKNKAAVKTTG